MQSRVRVNATYTEWQRLVGNPEFSVITAAVRRSGGEVVRESKITLLLNVGLAWSGLVWLGCDISVVEWPSLVAVPRLVQRKDRELQGPPQCPHMATAVVGVKIALPQHITPGEDAIGARGCTW